MGHSKLSVTIPDDIFNQLNDIASKEKTKLSHLVTEALIEKLRKKKEQAYIRQVNEVLKDEDVANEQRRMADLIADNTNVEELPW
jgi:metal-responsive CopG/Arc/MetJ family transcriptional regulator